MAALGVRRERSFAGARPGLAIACYVSPRQDVRMVRDAQGNGIQCNLVPLPASLLDLGIVAAHVVSTRVGDFQPPNIVQCCKPGPLEGSNDRRWSGAGMGTASSQPFKLYGS